MSGYPYDTGSSFIRYPSYYKHDAFGHVKGDDPGLGLAACSRRIPHTGNDVSPDKRGDKNARVLAPVYGTIIETGFDPEAGYYHIIKAYGRDEWWIGGHHDRFVKRTGNVERGELIAYMGDTGGALGVHTHWSVATSLAAARKYLTGYVSYRNGRSVAAWAAYEGLVDAWPLIEKEWAAHEAHLANLARAEREREERERAARAAAAEAAAQAEAEAAAEAAAREDSMKTRLVRATGGEVLVVNVADDFIWHVPNTKALPAAYVMADDPKIIDLDPDAMAALFAAMGQGRDADERDRLQAKLAPSR